MSHAVAKVREYETVYIMTPDADEAERTRVAERISGIVTGAGGTVGRTDEWGKRRLAYPIKRQGRGFYVYVRYQATGAAVAEIERVLRLMDRNLKFLTTRLEEGTPNEVVRPPEDVVQPERPQRRPARVVEVEAEDEIEEDET